ncbi:MULTISPECIES: hypothetical protein [Stenotrophomonas]|uniref:hypothetical protein n=1 Tax=Stenotrophomonas TaxID=40323 RepID=UPI001072C220|nr:hypothetical protein [Stenotrophomonas maltophilia]MCF3519563.1 hypothetical protein [Stenotrophomonas maltophilia]
MATSRTTLSLLLVSMALITSGCRTAAVISKEIALSTTTRASSRTFNLTAQLPAQLHMTLVAHYAPRDAKDLNCSGVTSFVSNIPGPRSVTKAFHLSSPDESKPSRVDIPVHYSIGACKLPLETVGLTLQNEPRKSAINSGEYRFHLHVRDATEDATSLNAGIKELRLTQHCKQLVHRSSSSKEELRKLLICDGRKEVNLDRKNLKEVSVRLHVTLDPIEAPLYQKNDKDCQGALLIHAPCIAANEAPRATKGPPHQTPTL